MAKSPKTDKSETGRTPEAETPENEALDPARKPEDEISPDPAAQDTLSGASTDETAEMGGAETGDTKPGDANTEDSVSGDTVSGGADPVLADEPTGDTEEPVAPADAETPVDVAADTPQAVEPPPATEPERSPPPVASPPPAPAPSGSGAGSMILGGVIAAVIGAGVVVLGQGMGVVSFGGPDEALLARIDELEKGLAATESDLEAAQSELTALSQKEPDLSAVNTAIDAVRAAAATANDGVSSLSDRLSATDERLSEVAVQQIPEAELPKAISDAYDAKLADLLATIDGRFETLQAGLDDKLAELESSQSAAAQAEADAQRAAQLATARAALSQVQGALETGAAYADPLQTVADLGGVEIPAALSGPAADGIPSLDALKASFPGYARDALTVSVRAAADEGSMSSWQAFLKSQTGARSLTPKEGDDPDAVLSRAEAALAEGDLDTTLSELQGLPQAGQDEMAKWVDMATQRRDTLKAADEVAAQLEQN